MDAQLKQGPFSLYFYNSAHVLARMFVYIYYNLECPHYVIITFKYI